MEEILAIAAGASQKNKKATTSTPAEQLQIMGTTPPEIIIEKLERCNHWYEISNDPILRKLSVHSYQSLRNLYDDLKVLQERQSTLGELFIDYLERHGQPDEYDFEELQEKSLLLDWLACQLCFQRPTRAKQLCIYGVPNTQKTLLFHLLPPVLSS